MAASRLAECWDCAPCRCIEDDCTLTHDPKPLITESQVLHHERLGHDVNRKPGEVRYGR